MTGHPALALTDAVADRLAHPDSAPIRPEHRQCLARGLPGIALLHIERAATGHGPWQRAHDWLAATCRQPLTSGPDSHPFYGAPAVAHAVARAVDHLPGSYQYALETLDRKIADDVLRRLSAAHRRVDASCLPALAEFDTIRGLTGYGAYLLHRNPNSTAVRGVLDYCVRLTEPITRDGHTLPGWWTSTGPSGHRDGRFPGGHANTGLAHGIGGVLALLALAARHGTLVDGHHAALRTILAWMDQWRHDTPGPGPAWPYWVTLSELRTKRRASPAPQRPSWCYGTAGLARAQQLAALALGDTSRQLDAESALVAALTDPAQLAATTDPALCHGFAGLAHVANRAAADAQPTTVTRLHAAIPQLLNAVHPPGTDPALATAELLDDTDRGPGLLDGAAGIGLSLLSAGTATPPRSAWDGCLLIT